MIKHNRYSHTIFIAIIFALITTTQSTLSVYNMQALGQNIPELLNIQYSIANFGFAPYGKTIIARLTHSPAYSDQCNIDKSDATNYENSFMLIPRGKCEFVKKTLNAEALGAQMAIIMDEKDHEQMVMMADNGYGYKVKIPSIFINHKDGQKLKQLIDDNEDSSVMMKITFDNKKTQKVDVTFWLQGNNRYSYKLVQDFRKFYPMIKQNINFKLVYSSATCASCQQSDCYFKKQYCAINLIHGQQSATGKLILDQQIREQIVHGLYPDIWWSYMKYVGDECGTISELKYCGQKGMKKYGIDTQKVQTAFSSSFTAQKDNTYLKLNQQTLKNAGMNRFPSVTLNGVKIKASLNAQFIFDDICNTLITAPSDCKKYIVNETDFQQTVTNKWATLLLVVIIGVILFSFIFCLYRRHMKKKISSQMSSRVDDMVSKYIEFYSERSGKK